MIIHLLVFFAYSWIACTVMIELQVTIIVVLKVHNADKTYRLSNIGIRQLIAIANAFLKAIASCNLSYLLSENQLLPPHSH
jgi:hypothetical protein